MPAATAGRSRSCARARSCRALGSQAFRRPITERDLNALMSLYKKAPPRAASRRASAWRSKASSPARASCSASRSGRRRAAAAGPTRSATSISRRACRFSCGRRGRTTSCCALAEAGRLSRRRRARAAGAAHARRSPRRRARDALRARSGCGCRISTRSIRTCACYPGLRRAAQDVDAPRDRAVLQTHRPRRPAGHRSCSRPTTRSSTSGWRGTTGIPDVVGSEFRQGDVSGCARRGLLGHGSILTLTSHADRTSPVLRGKWVLEVLLGTPPPPPPPDVPGPRSDGRGRRRPAAHRARAHGAASREPGVHVVPPDDRSDRPGARELRRDRRLAHQATTASPVDAASALYDGTPLTGPDDLRRRC